MFISIKLYVCKQININNILKYYNKNNYNSIKIECSSNKIHSRHHFNICQNKFLNLFNDKYIKEQHEGRFYKYQDINRIKNYIDNNKILENIDKETVFEEFLLTTCEQMFNIKSVLICKVFWNTLKCL